MTEIDPRFEALQARYRASLADKRADIEQAWQALCVDCSDAANQENVLRLVHRLAGSAESYGFTAIGRIAMQMDLQFDPIRRSVDPTQRATALRTMLDDPECRMFDLLAELQRGAASTPGDRASG